MNIKVKLEDIIEGIEFQCDYETRAYLEKNIGKVWVLAGDILAGAENNDKKNIMSYYEETEFELAKKIVQFPNNFIELPSKFDIHEYSIMKDFCYLIEDNEVKNRAFSAIKGKGAFRRFKELMHNCNLIDAWYKYRDNAIKQHAIDWCELNNITYKETET